MEYRSSEVKAGFFIFVSFIVLVIWVFSLGNLKEYFRPKKELLIIFNFAGGLGVGAPVHYAGLEVGRVKDISLSSAQNKLGMERVSVMVEINPSINIKKNSTAMIKTSGLMGGLYIDLRPGSKESPLLKANESLMGQDSFEFAKVGDLLGEFVNQIQRVANVADNLSVDTRNTLGTFQESLMGINKLIDGSQGYFQETMKNFSLISQDVSELLNQNKKGIEEAMIHFSSLAETADNVMREKGKTISNILNQIEKFTKELENLLNDNSSELTNLIHNMESGTQKITTEIESLGKNLGDTLKHGDEILIDNRRNLMQLIKNMKETSENLKDLTGDVKRNPWKLLRKTDEKFLLSGDEIKLEPQNVLRVKRLDKTPKP